jgi:hypothetical protein
VLIGPVPHRATVLKWWTMEFGKPRVVGGVSEFVV